MKKPVLRSVIAALSAGATLLCALLPALSCAGAERFFTGSGVHGEITMDPKRIPVTVSEIRDKEMAVALHYDGDTGNLCLEQFPCELLGRYKVSFTVQDSTLAQTDLEQALQLVVTAKNEDRVAWGDAYTFPVQVTALPDGAFQIEGHLIAYGTTLQIDTKGIAFSKETVCSEAGICGENSDYRLVKTHATEAENVYALVPKQAVLADGSQEEIPHGRFHQWAKRMCMYLNSLSDVTGIQKGYTYLSFCNDYGTGAGCTDPYAYSLFDDNATCIVSYTTACCGDILRGIYAGAQTMEWIELHELSHCYHYQVVEGLRNSFDAYYSPGSDETTANVRGLTALQNCTNLRDVELHFDGCTGSYATILQQKLESGDSSATIRFAGSLVHYAVDRGADGWEMLEAYCRGTDGKQINDLLPDSLSAFQTYTGIRVADGEAITRAALKYVNTLCFLYMYSGSQMAFDPVGFIAFLTEQVKYDLTTFNLRRYLILECNDGLGDIDQDGWVTMLDVLQLEEHLAHTRFLSEEELLHADLNRDGKVNLSDLILLQAVVRG